MLLLCCCLNCKKNTNKATNQIYFNGKKTSDTSSTANWVSFYFLGKKQKEKKCENRRSVGKCVMTFGGFWKQVMRFRLTPEPSCWRWVQTPSHHLLNSYLYTFSQHIFNQQPTKSYHHVLPRSFSGILPCRLFFVIIAQLNTTRKRWGCFLWFVWAVGLSLWMFLDVVVWLFRHVDFVTWTCLVGFTTWTFLGLADFVVGYFLGIRAL